MTPFGATLLWRISVPLCRGSQLEGHQSRVRGIPLPAGHKTLPGGSGAPPVHRQEEGGAGGPAGPVTGTCHALEGIIGSGAQLLKLHHSHTEAGCEQREGGQRLRESQAERLKPGWEAERACGHLSIFTSL